MGGIHLKRIAIVGECMVEIAGAGDACKLGFGGDTLNSALYAARLSNPNTQVSYVTRLGSDPYSTQMLAAWQQEGLDTDHVTQVEGRTVGLYAIQTDPDGERSFTYWRGASPARELFQGAYTETELKALEQADVVFASGITLAILSNTGRSNLIYAMHAAKTRGARVAFDINYRPALWEDESSAREALSEAYAASTLVFTSLEEEQSLNGHGDAKEIGQKLGALGVDEWVLRNSVEPIVIHDKGHLMEVPTAKADAVVDTTGAGDAFNGAYLAALCAGATAQNAAKSAALLAARVISYPGAVIARDNMLDLMPGTADIAAR